MRLLPFINLQYNVMYKRALFPTTTPPKRRNSYPLLLQRNDISTEGIPCTVLQKHRVIHFLQQSLFKKAFFIFGAMSETITMPWAIGVQPTICWKPGGGCLESGGLCFGPLLYFIIHSIRSNESTCQLSICMHDARKMHRTVLPKFSYLFSVRISKITVRRYVTPHQLYVYVCVCIEIATPSFQREQQYMVIARTQQQCKN